MDTISNRLNYAQETLDELLKALESLRRVTKAILEPNIPALIPSKGQPQNIYSVLNEVYVIEELVKEIAIDVSLAEQSYAGETAADRRLFQPELQRYPTLANTVTINDIKGSMAWMLTVQGCTRAIRRKLAESAPPKQHEVKFLVRQVSSLFGMSEESCFDPKPPVKENKSTVVVEVPDGAHALSAA